METFIIPSDGKPALVYWLKARVLNGSKGLMCSPSNISWGEAPLTIVYIKDGVVELPEFDSQGVERKRIAYMVETCE